MHRGRCGKRGGAHYRFQKGFGQITRPEDNVEWIPVPELKWSSARWIIFFIPGTNESRGFPSHVEFVLVRNFGCRWVFSDQTPFRKGYVTVPPPPQRGHRREQLILLVPILAALLPLMLMQGYFVGHHDRPYVYSRDQNLQGWPSNL